MKELVKQTFRFIDEKLPSSAIVNAGEVVFKDGKFITGRGTINVNDSVVFTFSVYTEKSGKLQINCNAPIDIDALGYIREFINTIS